MTTTTAYTPGGWVGIAGTDCWALVDLPIDDPRVRAAWQAAGGADPVDELLEVLLADGLRQAPGFVVLGRDGESLRYVVRRPASLAVETAGERTTYDGAGSWADGVLDHLPDAVALVAPDSAPVPLLPMAAGITTAGRVQVDLVGTTEVAPPEPEPEPEPAPEPTPAPLPAPPAIPPSRTDQDAPLEDPQQAATYYQLVSSSTSDREALLARLREDEELETAPLPVAPEPVAAPTEEPPRPEPEGRHETAVWDPEPPAPGPRPAPATGGLIDGLPWLTGGDAAPAPAPPAPSAPAPVPATAPVAPPANLDVTASRAQLLRSLAEERPAGPVVLAVLCPRGHLSPPYSPACRTCGAQLPQQAPVEVTRPALGRLSLSTGSTVLLDKGVVFGRSPHSDATEAADRPNLVRLIDSAEISRMHASVMLDGWQVLLRDLGSANGTTLTLPGGAAEQIRPHEDYPLEPGSVVSLADVVTFTFEVSS